MFRKSLKEIFIIQKRASFLGRIFLLQMKFMESVLKLLHLHPSFSRERPKFHIKKGEEDSEIYGIIKRPVGGNPSQLKEFKKIASKRKILGSYGVLWVSGKRPSLDGRIILLHMLNIERGQNRVLSFLYNEGINVWKEVFSFLYFPCSDFEVEIL